MKNEFPHNEVVDTLGDLFDVYDIGKRQLKDGFQFTDTFAVIEIYPKLKEVYDDRRVFVQQFLDLTPEESSKVVVELAQRINAPADETKQKITTVLALTSTTYSYLDMVVRGGKNLANDWKLAFAA